MVDVGDEDFARLIEQAIDALPEEYIQRLDNVAIVYADEPTPEQRRKLKLGCGQSLYGLYEGIPRISRGAGYNFVLPDKITIFKNPMIKDAPDIESLKKQVLRTVWHEIAHHYGLGHDRIHELEKKYQRKIVGQ